MWRQTVRVARHRRIKEAAAPHPSSPTARLNLSTSTSTSISSPADSRTLCRAREAAAQPSTISFLKRLFGSQPPLDPAVMEAARSKAQGLIDENPVVVFSKSWCPYCRSTKALLTEMGANFKVLELDQIDDGDQLQQALGKMTHQTSVPNVFIGQKHIGGNSELQSKKSQLPELLKAAHAV